MGNITSQDLLFPERVLARQPPPVERLNHLTYVDIRAAINLLWSAFEVQDPTRRDKKVFQRQAEVLQAVFEREWRGLSEGESDLVRGSREAYGLSFICMIYFESAATPSQLLTFIDEHWDDSPAAAWAFGTRRWLTKEWSAASPGLRKEVVTELQRVVYGLVGDRAEGDEPLLPNDRRFLDTRYAAFPALAQLLSEFRKSERRVHAKDSNFRPSRIRFVSLGDADDDVDMLDDDNARLPRGRHLPESRRDRAERERQEARVRNRVLGRPIVDNSLLPFQSNTLSGCAPPAEMGNLPSHSITPAAFSAIRPPANAAQVTGRDIARAIELLWVAFVEQNPSREDRPVFERQKSVLVEVVWAHWPKLHQTLQAGLWSDWMKLLLAVLQRRITDCHALDLLNNTWREFKLHNLGRLYFQSFETPEEFLSVIGDFRIKPVFRWAAETQIWLYYAWEMTMNPVLRMGAIEELQSVVNGLAGEEEEEMKGQGYRFGRLTGHEELFTDTHYSHFPSLGALLKNYQEKERRAGNNPHEVTFMGGDHLSEHVDPKREWRLDRQERERREGGRRGRSASPAQNTAGHDSSAHSLARRSPYSRRQRAIYQL
ncbi:hypothetical protein JCM6882_009399 [Rhodosporidiobolus microsporus]